MTMTMRIGLTQRVTVVEEYSERRDCIDQNWAELLESVGYVPVPLPNRIAEPADYLEQMKIDGLVLTGGNDLAHIEGGENTASERDAFETAAVAYALESDLPILGVCRGLQLLNVYFGGTLDHIDNHIAQDHAVEFEADQPFLPDGEITVNSYHSYGIKPDSVANSLTILATASDNSVECLRLPDRPVYGIMWHPERESPSESLDRQLFEHLFGCPN